MTDYDPDDPGTWRHHPSFPHQVLLLGSHANFRRISRYLIDEHRGADLVRLEMLYRRWIGAMRSHEAYEEHKLYPYLERRFDCSLQSSRQGHERLHQAGDEVLAAFESEDRERLGRALEAHDAILDDHLDVEERGVIPRLLSLERAEFVELCNNPIHRLLRELEARDGEADKRQVGQ